MSSVATLTTKGGYIISCIAFLKKYVSLRGMYPLDWWIVLITRGKYHPFMVKCLIYT